MANCVWELSSIAIAGVVGSIIFPAMVSSSLSHMRFPVEKRTGIAAWIIFFTLLIGLPDFATQLARLKAERDRAHSYQAHREELKRQEAFLLLARLKEASLELAGLDEEINSLEVKNQTLLERSESKKTELSALDEKLQIHKLGDHSQRRR